MIVAPKALIWMTQSAVLALLLHGNVHSGADNWEQLFAGVIQVDTVENADGIPGVKASFIVRASADEIWAALIDYENFTEIFLEMDRVNVLQQDSGGAVVEFWLSIFLARYHYVLDRRYEQWGKRLTWRRVRGDLERIEGAWEIFPTPRQDARLVVYESHVDPGGFLLPSLIRWQAAGKARRMAERLREWIESHPSSTPGRAGQENGR